MSDLGNGGWPNSMKLGEDINLDELLKSRVWLTLYVLVCNFPGGVPFRGPKSPKNHLSESQLSSHIKITTESPQKI